MKVKRQADVHLTGSDLDWVIVRPGALTNDPGTGRVRIGMAIPYGEVSRDDLATVLVELIHMPRIRRTILELTGGETPITEALECAVRERVGDRFEATCLVIEKSQVVVHER